MKKLLILFLIFFIGFSINTAYSKPVKRELLEHQEVYDAYFEEYAKDLFENYHPEKNIFRFFFMCESFRYALMSDGTIRELRHAFNNNGFEKYGRKVITNTKPKPFPPEMKDNYIVLDVVMYYDNDESHYEIFPCKRTPKIYWFTFQNLDNLDYYNIVRICLYRKARYLTTKSNKEDED